MLRDAARSLWAEPRVPNPPARVWRDWALVAVLVPVAILEGLLRDNLAWRPYALVLGVLPVFTLLWRRTNPLVVVALASGAHAAADLPTLFGAEHSAMLGTNAFVLLLPYSLFRWGSGREAATGMAIIGGGHLASAVVTSTDAVALVFGIGFLMFLAALGASVRFRTSSRLRGMDQVKLRERELLARDLHDTVAHHVSAIAIRAQAGRVVGASDPAAAMDALVVIEEEASRTLAEMRSIVGTLRHGDEPDLAPQRGVADIERLITDTGHRPHVDVELSGDLDGLPPSVDAALYRLAQESITNAVRHARRATRIHVAVSGDDDCVRLTVGDDGDAGPFDPRSSSGFGLIGMAERAKLLGGTLQAGPNRDRGWTVQAVLPRGRGRS